jgi:CubicO group peptidase (beta-lactamase class C family)
LPADITTYGLLINGVHYVSGCQTRYGAYAFCDNMRLPSYSIAKSTFAGLAMMLLGQQFKTAVYGQLIRSYVPQYSDGGEWTNVTFSNTADMATGNYLSSGIDADESSPQERSFLTAEPYSAKIADAFTPFPHKAVPGTTWVYQTHATFILTQAMNSYLQQQQGSGADIFNAIRDSVFKPLNMSQGSQSTLRTGNSASGKPFGGYGLFFIQDDVAKIGRFLNNSGGAINGAQVLEPTRLQESLFRAANPAALGVPVPDRGMSTVPNTFRYHNFFWAKYMTTTEFPQYRCNFWVSFMSGYGGNTVLLLPNGVTYYLFSDGNEFHWYTAVNEINKIAPLCH